MHSDFISSRTIFIAFFAPSESSVEAAGAISFNIFCSFTSDEGQATDTLSIRLLFFNPKFSDSLCSRLRLVTLSHPCWLGAVCPGVQSTRVLLYRHVVFSKSTTSRPGGPGRSTFISRTMVFFSVVSKIRRVSSFSGIRIIYRSL